MSAQRLSLFLQRRRIKHLIHKHLVFSRKPSLPLWGRWQPKGLTYEVLRYFPSFHSSIICFEERVISRLNSLFHLRFKNASSHLSNASPVSP